MTFFEQLAQHRREVRLADEARREAEYEAAARELRLNDLEARIAEEYDGIAKIFAGAQARIAAQAATLQLEIQALEEAKAAAEATEGNSDSASTTAPMSRTASETISEEECAVLVKQEPKPAAVEATTAATEQRYQLRKRKAPPNSGNGVPPKKIALPTPSDEMKKEAEEAIKGTFDRTRLRPRLGAI